MRLQLNRSLSTFLLVLSILAIVVGAALVQYGQFWLTHSSPPLLPLGVIGVVIVLLALRAIWKRP